jgi:hypothetical protein
MARPKTADHLRCRNQIAAKINDGELAFLRADAHRLGIGEAAYLRQLLRDRIMATTLEDNRAMQRSYAEHESSVAQQSTNAPVGACVDADR